MYEADSIVGAALASTSAFLSDAARHVATSQGCPCIFQQYVPKALEVT